MALLSPAPRPGQERHKRVNERLGLMRKRIVEGVGQRQHGEQSNARGVEAFEALLGDRPFVGGSRPVMADIAAYGLIAPMAK